MEKRSLTAIAAVLLACTLTACGTPKSSKKYSEVSGDAQKADSPEDALNEAYAAVYTPDSGEVCYKYMYPGLTIQALKEQDMYENSIQNFNTGQKGYIDLIEQQPKIVSIDKKVAFTEEQLASANEFFAAVSAQAGIYTRSSNFKAIEGYEFTCSITNTTGEADTDVECMVFLENDGWKNIPYSLEDMLKITDSFDEDALIESVTDSQEYNTTSPSNE